MAKLYGYRCDVCSATTAHGTPAFTIYSQEGDVVIVRGNPVARQDTIECCGRKCLFVALSHKEELT